MALHGHLNLYVIRLGSYDLHWQGVHSFVSRKLAMQPGKATNRKINGVSGGKGRAGGRCFAAPDACQIVGKKGAGTAAIARRRWAPDPQVRGKGGHRGAQRDLIDQRIGHRRI